MQKVSGRFDLDIRALQRALLPFVLLNELAKAKESLPALRLKDRVVEAMDRAFPADSGIDSGLLPVDSHFEFHVSVLYPMVEHMMAKERKYLKRETAGPLIITDDGLKALELWKRALKGLDSLLQ